SGGWSPDQGIRPIPSRPTRPFLYPPQLPARCHRASRSWCNIRLLQAAGGLPMFLLLGAGLLHRQASAYYSGTWACSSFVTFVCKIQKEADKPLFVNLYEAL